MAPDVRALGLHRVVGTKDASWFSPAAENSAAPYAQVLACRMLPSVNLFEYTWLVRLFSLRIAVRRVNTSDWSIAIGDICGTIVKAWPLELKGGVYTPIINDSSVACTDVCTDEDDWMAMPLAPVSPMRRACMQEVANEGHFSGNLVQLHESAHYGKLQIAAVPTDEPRFLIDAAVRQCFWDLPCNCLRKLAMYLETPMMGTDLFGIITSIGTQKIPEQEQTFELWASIYMKRDICFELDEDLDELCELEEVLDCFEPGDRNTLETDITSAKTTRSERTDFQKSVCDWKVCAAWHDKIM